MRQRDRLLPGTIALTVMAVLVAAWSGWTWWSTAHDPATARARDRDAVLSAATDALVALNTIDYRDPGPAVDRWIQVTTGELGTTLSGDRQLQIDRTTATRTVASASVTQAAVAALDESAGTARVIAVLDIRLSTNGGSPAPDRSRLNAVLNRTGTGWKVSAVQAAG
jgi:Mce-associated membrane protein